MPKKILNIFILVLLLSSFNCAMAKEKPSKIDTFNYVNIGFWKNFNDKTLTNDLIAVYNNNNDLKATAFKVKEAQRLVKISLSNELPHIGFEGYVGRVFDSSDELYGDVVIPNYSESHFLLPLTMNYEIDIWGENRLKTKSQAKQLQMLQQDERALYIALTSAFASDYYNLIKTDKLIQLQKDLMKTQERIISSVQKKYNKGTATINDVILAKKALTYMQEEFNNLEDKQDVLKNQLNVFLSDRTFSDLPRTDFNDLTYATYVPKEIPLNMLEKRPDWVKQELALQKIGYDVRIAKKDFLPKINLVGNLGFNFYDLSSSNSFLSSLGLAPSLDIFTGGRKVQILKLQKYKYSEALQTYDKVILTSMQETNDALYNLKANDKKFLISQDRLNLDKHEMYLMQKKSVFGTADNLDLLIKQEQILISEKQAVSLRINDIIASINLYKAIGGEDYFKKDIKENL